MAAVVVVALLLRLLGEGRAKSGAAGSPAGACGRGS